MKSLSRSGHELSRAYFPGPESENEKWVRIQFKAILDDWFSWRRDRFPDDPEAVGDEAQKADTFRVEHDRLARALNELVDALRAEGPSYSPRYIGHMV